MNTPCGHCRPSRKCPCYWGRTPIQRPQCDGTHNSQLRFLTLNNIFASHSHLWADMLRIISGALLCFLSLAANAGTASSYFQVNTTIRLEGAPDVPLTVSPAVMVGVPALIERYQPSTNQGVRIQLLVESVDSEGNATISVEVERAAPNEKWKTALRYKAAIKQGTEATFNRGKTEMALNIATISDETLHKKFGKTIPVPKPCDTVSEVFELPASAARVGCCETVDCSSPPIRCCGVIWCCDGSCCCFAG